MPWLIRPKVSPLHLIASNEKESRKSERGWREFDEGSVGMQMPCAALGRGTDVRAHEASQQALALLCVHLKIPPCTDCGPDAHAYQAFNQCCCFCLMPFALCVA